MKKVVELHLFLEVNRLFKYSDELIKSLPKIILPAMNLLLIKQSIFSLCIIKGAMHE
jgi:hypothetical protein